MLFFLLVYFFFRLRMPSWIWTLTCICLFFLFYFNFRLRMPSWIRTLSSAIFLLCVFNPCFFFCFRLRMPSWIRTLLSATANSKPWVSKSVCLCTYIHRYVCVHIYTDIALERVLLFFFYGESQAMGVKIGVYMYTNIIYLDRYKY